MNKQKKADDMEKKIHLGELLKDTRERKNLTIEDVARIIKIRIEFLKALETENYSSLPERTYSLGYFRAYANFLEIKDVESLVEKLDENYPFNSPEYAQRKGQVFLDEEYSLINTFKKKIKKDNYDEHSKDTTKKTQNKKEKLESLEERGFSSQNKLIIVLALFLVIFLFLGYKLLSGKDSSEDKDIDVVESINLENNPSEKKAIDSVINNDFVIVENKDEKIEPQAKNPIEDTKINDIQVKDSYVPNVTEMQDEDELAKEPKIEVKYESWPKQTRNYQISIAFAEDVWVQIYKQDDPSVVYLDRIFKAGDIYDIPKVDDIAMRVGNYKGIKILVDSKEIVLTSKKRLSVVLGDIILEKNSLLDKYPLVNR